LKLIVGLGNPGEKYSQTRHNVGFMVVEELARRADLPLRKKSHLGFFAQGRLCSQQAALLLPQTFMNLSGASVASAFKSLGLSPGDLIVVHDDIDTVFGTLRIKQGGGHGGQNGVRHICEVLGTGDFLRLKVGIGRPMEGGDVSRHVLSSFSSVERSHLEKLIGGAAVALETLLGQGPTLAMNMFNGKSFC